MLPLRMTEQDTQNIFYVAMFEMRTTNDATNFIKSSTAVYTDQVRNRSVPLSYVPRGTDIIDTWIDFCSLIDAGKYREAFGDYFRLKRFLSAD